MTRDATRTDAPSSGTGHAAGEPRARTTGATTGGAASPLASAANEAHAPNAARPNSSTSTISTGSASSARERTTRRTSCCSATAATPASLERSRPGSSRRPRASVNRSRTTRLRSCRPGDAPASAQSAWGSTTTPGAITPAGSGARLLYGLRSRGGPQLSKGHEKNCRGAVSPEPTEFDLLVVAHKQDHRDLPLLANADVPRPGRRIRRFRRSIANRSDRRLSRRARSGRSAHRARRQSPSSIGYCARTASMCRCSGRTVPSTYSRPIISANASPTTITISSIRWPQ